MRPCLPAVLTWWGAVLILLFKSVIHRLWQLPPVLLWSSGSGIRPWRRQSRVFPGTAVHMHHPTHQRHTEKSFSSSTSADPHLFSLLIKFLCLLNLNCTIILYGFLVQKVFHQLSWRWLITGEYLLMQICDIAMRWNLRVMFLSFLFT